MDNTSIDRKFSSRQIAVPVIVAACVGCSGAERVEVFLAGSISENTCESHVLVADVPSSCTLSCALDRMPVASGRVDIDADGTVSAVCIPDDRYDFVTFALYYDAEAHEFYGRCNVVLPFCDVSYRVFEVPAR